MKKFIFVILDQKLYAPILKFVEGENLFHACKVLFLNKDNFKGTQTFSFVDELLEELELLKGQRNDVIADFLEEVNLEYNAGIFVYDENGKLLAG